MSEQLANEALPVVRECGCRYIYIYMYISVNSITSFNEEGVGD